MKHHAEVGSMERDFAQDLRGASERDQRLEQSRGITYERDAQPDQGHHSLMFPRGGLDLPARLGDYMSGEEARGTGGLPPGFATGSQGGMVLQDSEPAADPLFRRSPSAIYSCCMGFTLHGPWRPQTLPAEAPD